MKKIAVVEDNPDNRLLLQVILEGQFELVEYADGVSALSGITASPPDLVLMDISLPGMDGEEVLGQLRADPALRDIPAIALTAHAMVGDRERLLQAGFDEYVTKPVVNERVLLDAIERLLVAA